MEKYYPANDGYFYWMADYKMNRAESYNYCHNNGGFLIKPKTKFHLNVIYSLTNMLSGKRSGKKICLTLLMKQ